MRDKFIENIKAGFINKIEEIIKDSKLQAERKNLNAIDTLELVNKNINTWISTINGIINIDDELLYEIAIRKKPLVQAAKKEVAMEVSRIIENEQYDVALMITKYINALKKRGISLEGVIEKKTTEPEPDINTNTSDEEPLYEYDRQLVLRKKPKKKKKDSDDTYDTYIDTYCGADSGCC